MPSSNEFLRRWVGSPVRGRRACGGLLMLALPFLVRSTPAQDLAADRTAELIRQLGSPLYIERQMATETLSTLGMQAAGPVRAALQSDDPEVRFRAEQILRAIRFDDRQRLINAFIAGTEVGENDDLPGWNEFRALAGASPEARNLYVAMLEAEWNFLEAVHHADPADVGHLWIARAFALENSQRETRDRQDIPVGSVAALLLIAVRDQVDLPNQANLMSLCYRSQEFNAALRAGPNRDALRILLGKLISKDSGSPYLTQRFHFALQYDLKEALVPARQVLNERTGISHVRQYAILVLGKLGTDDDLKLIEQLLDDTALVSSHNRVNNVRITTQVRDIALAVLLHRSGQDVTEYGLPDFRLNSTTLIQTSTIGFATDEQREQAIAKWQSRQQPPVAPGEATQPE